MNDNRLHQVFLRDLFHARPPGELANVRFTTVLGRSEFTELRGAEALPGEPAARQLASSSDYRVFVALRDERVAAVCCVRLGSPAWPARGSSRARSRSSLSDVYEPRVARLVHVSSRPGELPTGLSSPHATMQAHRSSAAAPRGLRPEDPESDV